MSNQLCNVLCILYLVYVSMLLDTFISVRINKEYSALVYFTLYIYEKPTSPPREGL